MLSFLLKLIVTVSSATIDDFDSVGVDAVTGTDTDLECDAAPPQKRFALVLIEGDAPSVEVKEPLAYVR